MASSPYYSPRIDRGLVTRLYFAAKARNVPMTVLTNRLVTDGLDRMQEVPSPDPPDPGSSHGPPGGGSINNPGT